MGANAAADAAVPLLLQAGSRLHQSLQPGEVLQYRLALPTGQAAELVVQQDQGLVELRRSAPAASGTPPRVTVAGRMARIRWTLIADGGQELDFAVAPVNSQKRPANYWISLNSMHPAGADDRLRVQAEEALAAAEALRLGGKAPSGQAIPFYAAARASWAKAGDACGVRAANLALAKYQESISRYQDVLAPARAAADKSCPDDLAERAAAESMLGAALGNRGDYSTSLAAGRRAIALFERIGDPGREARTWSNQMEVYRQLGESAQALDAGATALRLARQAGDDETGLVVRMEVAATYADRGELMPSLEEFRKVLAALPAQPEKSDPDSHYPIWAGTTWSDLGSLYRKLGDSAASFQADARAEAICSAIQEWVCLVVTTDNRADALLDDGRVGEAEAAYRKVIELARKLDAKDSMEQGLRGLARCAMARKDTVQAEAQLKAAQAALPSDQEPDDQAQTYGALGDFAMQQGRPAAALAQYRHQLRLVRQSGNAVLQVAALGNLARASRQAGDLHSAVRDMDQAIRLIEKERVQINDPGLRTSYFSSMRAYYELYIDLLMQLDRRLPGRGYAAAALVASERCRARLLLDLLAQRALTVDAEVEPALLAQERTAEEHAHALAYQEAQLPAGDQRRPRLEVELAQAEQQLDALHGRVRKANPHYAELVRPQPLSLAEVQNALLDADTSLLEFWLGDARSYLWLVSRQGLRSYVLPPRAQIEAQADALLRALTAHPAASSGQSMQQLAAQESGDRSTVENLGTVLGDVLMLPQARAAGSRNLLVVADGVLQRLPFELLDPQAAGAAATPQHRLIYLPSVETLRWLRRGQHAAPAADQLAANLAVIADPVFSADDPRLRQPPGQAPAAPDQVVLRAARDAGVELSRLGHSRDEAEAIAALRPPASVWLALDFDANRQALLRADWSKYAVVHFATHSLLDLQHPELSGIVLSLYDAAGHPQDGYLRMSDVYRLHLPADLVVLSTCESAAGSSVGEEGIFSLARAFFYAGSRRVLASLWPVEDRAGAQFMQDFYTALFKQHQPPAAALATAQGQMAADPRWSAPFYWAGYVLQGDWR